MRKLIMGFAVSSMILTACNKAPELGMTVPTTGVAGENVAMTSGGDIKKAYNVNWSFGDGGSSTLGSPAHTYTTAGTYTVILTGTLGNCSSSNTITINVGFTGLEEVNLAESVNLYPNPSNGEFNLSLNFEREQNIEIR